MKSIDSDSHLDKTDVNTKMNVFSPYGEYQYHVPDSQPSVPLQYVHVFTVPSMTNAVGSDRSSEPISTGTNLEIMATQPHTDSSPNKDSDNESDSVEEDRNDVIDDVETEGNRLDDATLVNPCDETLQPGTGSLRETTQLRLQHELETHPREANKRDGHLRQAPTQLQAGAALKHLKNVLHPPRKTGAGYQDPKIDPFARIRMEGMQTMLNFYTNPRSTTFDKWGASACQAAISLGRGQYCARQLAKLSRQFIQDNTILPVNPYGNWNESLLADEDLASDISLHLQELGKDISAKKVVQFLTREDIKEKHGITKNISQRTACRYLKSLGYRFAAPKKGQYADGHERADVVWYREKKFLPAWQEIQDRMYSWTKDNIPEDISLQGKRVIVWFHDESIFYAHDRRKKGWYHKDAPAKPYTKGEGASLMVADYVSADFGWLQSPDGSRNARRVMKPGKNRDGYFTSDDIGEQAQAAMDILTEFYPQYEHYFIYDNAPSHLKRPEGSVTARRMPKFTPKIGNNWGIEAAKRDTAGNLVYNADGSLAKEKIRMGNTVLSDGTVQSLYFPDGHARAGVFKGMAVILEERGYTGAHQMRAECKSFNCAPPALDCCCRRILFNEPDFAHVDTILETTCSARGFQVIFLPKFHCELNFIEQCWGYAKRLYRLNPESSREDHLERNALAALKAIPLESMRR
jgi:hypothetical protein